MMVSILAVILSISLGCIYFCLLGIKKRRETEENRKSILAKLEADVYGSESGSEGYETESECKSASKSVS